MPDIQVLSISAPKQPVLDLMFFADLVEHMVKGLFVPDWTAPFNFPPAAQA
jgi:hypothetical protein